MKKDKKGFFIIICILVFLIGIGVLLYPIIYSKYSESVRSDVYTEYMENVEDKTDREVDKEFEDAVKFNELLFNKEIDHLDPKNNGYYNQLDLVDNGIMAYVSVPKIGIKLPIHHGTGDSALKNGCGHMPQSSLPVGGINTHAVISAHTGMSENPMFSDLELIEEGDIFQIEVLNRTLTYEVYEINVVSPYDIELIQIQKDKDLCTLITCTPYGINTHRLLVQGERIPNPDKDELSDLTEQAENDDIGSVWLSEYYQSVILGLIISASILVLIGLILLVRRVLVKRKRNKNEG